MHTPPIDLDFLDDSPSGTQPANAREHSVALVLARSHQAEVPFLRICIIWAACFLGVVLPWAEVAEKVTAHQTMWSASHATSFTCKESVLSCPLVMPLLVVNNICMTPTCT